MNRLRTLTGQEIDKARELTWYALIVPPQREFDVQRILDRKGLSAFVPVEWRWRKKSRYVKHKEKIPFPAFPRLVFIGAPAGTQPNWSWLVGIHLVNGWFAAPGAHVPLRFRTDDVIQVMRASKTPLFSAPDHHAYMQTGCEFAAGDEARILAGSLEGWKIKVKRIEGQEAVFDMEAFGKVQEQRAALGNLEKAA